MNVAVDVLTLQYCARCGATHSGQRVHTLPGKFTSGWQCKNCLTITPDKASCESFYISICSAMGIPIPTDPAYRQFIVDAYDTGEALGYCHDRPLMIPCNGDLMFWREKFKCRVNMSIFTGAGRDRKVIWPVLPQSNKFEKTLHEMFGLKE